MYDNKSRTFPQGNRRKVRDKQLTALIVGFGSIGKRHAENLRKLSIRDIIFLRHAARGRLPANHVASIAAALARKPDFAIIANPTSLHISAAKRLARAGVHLFIEKPLSHTMTGIPELIRTARRKKLTTMVGYNFRFHPQLRRMKELLDRGVIGKVVSARVEAGQYLPDWHPGEDYRKGYAARKALGGGVILTLIHEIDYISWLLGKPEAVFCFADHLSDLRIDVEDVAEILIRFRGGAVGEVHLDYIQRAPARRAQIIGTKGTMRWDYFKGELRVYSAKTKKWIVHRDPKNFDRNTMFLQETKHFLACVRGGKQTAIPLREGVASLRTALAAKQSAASGTMIRL